VLDQRPRDVGEHAVHVRGGDPVRAHDGVCADAPDDLGARGELPDFFGHALGKPFAEPA